MPKENYRDNVVEIRKQDGEDRLYVNDKKIDVQKADQGGRTVFRSEFTYGDYGSLEELGRAVIDTQSSLTKPKLDTLRKPQE
jgi:hypothetical protein